MNESFEFNITANGKSFTFKTTELQMQVLIKVLDWLKRTNFGKFEIKKEADKITTNKSESDIIK